MIELGKLHAEWLSHTRLIPHVDYVNTNKELMPFGEYIVHHYYNYSMPQEHELMRIYYMENNYTAYQALIVYHFNLLKETLIVK